MKKIVYISAIITMLLLVACSPVNVIGTAISATRTSGINEDFDNALPAQAQLALGVILLDNTNLAVNETQAQQLLPLWQTAASRAESESTSGGEVTALTNLIKGALSSEQIAAISAMQLSRSTVREMIQAGTLQIADGQSNAGSAAVSLGGRAAGEDLTGVDREEFELGGIDAALLETRQPQNDDNAAVIGALLSEALAQQVIELLATKAG